MNKPNYLLQLRIGDKIFFQDYNQFDENMYGIQYVKCVWKIKWK